MPEFDEGDLGDPGEEPAPEPSPLQDLSRLRDVASSAQSAWLEAIGGTPPEVAKVHLHTASDHATPAALTLYTLDRELRRAATVIRNDFAWPGDRFVSINQVFRPMPLSSGGLTIEHVETESPPIFDLAGFGLIAQLLLSDPVQLLITTKELLGWSGRIVIRVKQAFGQEKVVYSSEGVLLASERGFQIREVPEGTRIRVTHRSSDGTETKFEIDRS